MKNMVYVILVSLFKLFRNVSSRQKRKNQQINQKTDNLKFSAKIGQKSRKIRKTFSIFCI